PRIDQGTHDLDVALRFEALGSNPRETAWGDNPGQPDEFEAAFRDAGLGQVHEDPEAVAARLRASSIRDALILGLDQWALFTGDMSRRKWLLEVARLADPDPSGWRALAGDLTNLEDDAILDKLVRTAPHPFPSIPVLIAVQLRLIDRKRDPVPFLTRIQEAHP